MSCIAIFQNASLHLFLFIMHLYKGDVLKKIL